MIRTAFSLHPKHGRMGAFACCLCTFFLLFISLGPPLQPANGQDFIDEKESLRGLSGVYIMGGDIDDELAQIGLQKEDILALVSARLISSGVPVLDESAWLLEEDSPVLHIELSSSVDHEMYALYAIRLEVLFLMNKLSDDRFTTYAVVWGEGKIGLLDSAAFELIREDLEILVDRLATDFHAVNS